MKRILYGDPTRLAQQNEALELAKEVTPPPGARPVQTLVQRTRGAARSAASARAPTLPPGRTGAGWHPRCCCRRHPPARTSPAYRSFQHARPTAAPNGRRPTAAEAGAQK
eukprot:scaffold2080_cov118-Isochrysis_galbana.AAC.3